MKEILISSSVLILMIILVRRLFRSRVSKRLMYGIWLLAVVRLLLPFQIGTSDISVLGMAETAEQSAPVQAVIQQFEAPAAPTMPMPTAPDMTAPAVTAPAVTAPAEVTVTEPAVMEPVKETVKIDFKSVAIAVWVAGSALIAAWFAFVNIRYAANAKRGSYALDCPESPVPVRVSRNVTTPCLVGSFRPVVYLTPAVADNENSRRHVLAHELTHYRHKDNWWSLLRCLCLCVYWFNPLVWIAAILSKRDCELACDEGALGRLEENDRFAYGRTLLETISGGQKRDIFLTNTAMSGTKKTALERINAIVSRKHFTVTAAVIVIAIAAIAAVVTYTGADKKQNGDLLDSIALHNFPESTEITPVQPMMVGPVEYTREHDEVDAELATLWRCCEAAYSPFDCPFTLGSEDVTFDAMTYREILNYEEVVNRIFTAAGRESYEKYMEKYLNLREENGKKYQRISQATPYYNVYVQTKVTGRDADGSLTLCTGYIDYELDTYQPFYKLRPWKAVQEDGKWKVDYTESPDYQTDLTDVLLNFGGSITGANSSDMTYTVVKLWYDVNNAYNTYPIVMGKAIVVGSVATDFDGDGYVCMDDYEGDMLKLFSENGKKQYMNARLNTDGGVKNLINEKKGTYYHLISDEVKANNYGCTLVSVVTEKSSADRMELQVTFRNYSRDGSCYQDCTVPFVIVKENKWWVVEDYRYPACVDSTVVEDKGSYTPEEQLYFFKEWMTQQKLKREAEEIQTPVDGMEPTESWVLDPKGMDITEEIIDLWNSFAAAYNVYTAPFHYNDERVNVNEGKYIGVDNYEAVVNYLFTENGRAQYEGYMFANDFFLYREPETGKVFINSGYSTGWRNVHVDTRATGSEENKLHLVTGYYYREGAEYMSPYKTMTWTIAKVDGQWKVDSVDMSNAVQPEQAYQYHRGIRVEDADGENITQEAVALWYRANSAYETDNFAVFSSEPEAETFAVNGYTFMEAPMYDEYIGTIFSENGQKQYENTVMRFDNELVYPFMRRGDRVYRLCIGDGTMGNYGRKLLDMTVEESSADRICLNVTYRNFTEDCKSYARVTVPFTIVKVNGAWVVEDYTYPDSGAETAAAWSFDWFPGDNQ